MIWLFSRHQKIRLEWFEFKTLDLRRLLDDQIKNAIVDVGIVNDFDSPQLSILNAEFYVTFTAQCTCHQPISIVANLKESVAEWSRSWKSLRIKKICRASAIWCTCFQFTDRFSRNRGTNAAQNILDLRLLELKIKRERRSAEFSSHQKVGKQPAPPAAGTHKMRKQKKLNHLQIKNIFWTGPSKSFRCGHL